MSFDAPDGGGKSVPALRLVAGNSNRPLAEAISSYLKVPLAKSQVKRFADMEIFVEIQENVRGRDCFIIQSTSFPANDNLVELLVLIDALKRASARRITAVIPYYGYARQDRKPGPRTPISAKLVANLLERAGVDRVLTLDLHAGRSKASLISRRTTCLPRLLLCATSMSKTIQTTLSSYHRTLVVLSARGGWRSASTYRLPYATNVASGRVNQKS